MPYKSTIKNRGTTLFAVEETTPNEFKVPAAGDAFRHAGFNASSETTELPIVEFTDDNDPQKGAIYQANHSLNQLTTLVRPPKVITDPPPVDAFLENFFGASAVGQGNRRTYTIKGDNDKRLSMYESSNIDQTALGGVIISTLTIRWSAGGYCFLDFGGFANSLAGFTEFSTRFASGKLDEILPATGLDIRSLISGPGPIIKAEGVTAAQQVTAVDDDKATVAGDFTGASTTADSELTNGLPEPTYADVGDPATGKQGKLIFGPDDGTTPSISSAFDDDIASGKDARMDCNDGSITLNNGRYIDYSSWGEDVTYPLAFDIRRSQFSITTKATTQAMRMVNLVRGEQNKSYGIVLAMSLTSGIYQQLIMPQVTLRSTLNPPPAQGQRGNTTVTFQGALTVPGGQTNKEARWEVLT